MSAVGGRELIMLDTVERGCFVIGGPMAGWMFPVIGRGVTTLILEWGREYAENPLTRPITCSLPVALNLLLTLLPNRRDPSFTHSAGFTGFPLAAGMD